MDERQFGWVNIIYQYKCNNTDLSIMKYSLENSDSGNFTCMKMGRDYVKYCLLRLILWYLE